MLKAWRERAPCQRSCIEVLFELCRDCNAARSQESTETNHHINQLVSGASFNAKELPWLLIEVDSSRLLLEDSTNKSLAAEGFAKKYVRTRSGSSSSRGVLYKKRFLAFYGD